MPNSAAETFQSDGQAHLAAGRLDDAIASYRGAIALQPADAATWNNLGLALQQQHRLLDAAAALHNARALRPDLADIHNNFAGVLLLLNRPRKAIESYRHALTLDPHHTEAHANLGQALAKIGQRDAAIASFTRALELNPDHLTAFTERALQRLHQCDWQDFDAERTRLLTLSRQGATIPPFLLRAAGATPADMLAAARRVTQPLKPPTAPFTHQPRDPTRRLRVGYFSSDFRQHRVTLLASELFERHDRTRFELFAYSNSPDDDSAARHRLVRTFDHFIDIRALSDDDAARRIHDDAIDILVDLNGLTTGHRLAIAARRPAPVQASWLGYIGTTGADFIDYVIADPFAVPTDQQPYYAERIAHLPNCYLPLDTTREIAYPPPRTSFGLPATGFVFCCFNNGYKITPETFAAWMRILAAVPDSVLWLLDAGPTVTANLRREAAAHGAAPERLVFAPSVPLAEYFPRFRHADLFLDTLPCSACTIGADALLAGLPLLTRVGEIFAGRDAGSMLRAAGLPELLTESLADYESLAVRLATESGLLGGLRARLYKTLWQKSAPLFDTARFARELEAIYIRMAESAFTPSV